MGPVRGTSPLMEPSSGKRSSAASSGAERRGVKPIPEALTSAFYSNMRTYKSLWQSYGHRTDNYLSPPPSAFEEIGNRVQMFLGPVRESIMAQVRFERHWPAGGPWRSHSVSVGRSGEQGESDV